MRPAMDPQSSWQFLPLGYLFTVCVETPILLLGLSPRHSWGRRLFCGIWLNACSYPIVVLVFPMLIDITDQRWLYLLVAETFAPIAECALFWAAFGSREEWGKGSMWRDFAVITLANLISFGPAEIVVQLHLHGKLPPSIEQFFQ
jgi:hypothetical protein